MSANKLARIHDTRANWRVVTLWRHSISIVTHGPHHVLAELQQFLGAIAIEMRVWENDLMV